MSTAAFALAAGIVYTLVGIVGMFPAALTPPPAGVPAPTIAVLYGYLLGLFPVNVLHSAVHIAIGIAGLAASTAERPARLYARALTVIYGALGVLGLLPAPFNILFGSVPLHGHDIWLHLGTAAVAAYFGWRADIPVLQEPHVSRERRFGVAERRETVTTVARERRHGAYDRRMPPLGT